MSCNQTAIKLDDVSKKYLIYTKPIDRLMQYINPNNKRFKEFEALQPLSINVARGKTVGIVGRNGSGKSTLLQMIAGTLAPSTGRIQVNGRVSALLELGAGFNPEFTGRENVYLNASILGIPPKELEKRFDEILEFSEIGEFIDRPVKTYSSGMFVRLAFSVATITEPEIVIIDEALSVGDEKFQRKCYNHLEKLKDNGCTILFVSHSMKTVEQLCDYAYLLDKGVLIGEGEPKKIIDQYHLLLYSQENEHMMHLNKQTTTNQRAEVQKIEESRPEEADNSKQVRIESIKLYNHFNAESYLFKPNDYCKIVLTLDSSIVDDDVAIGLRIKTTQGIEVFGTSTLYHDISVNLQTNKRYNVSFEQKLPLIDGTYHISAAVAKKIGSNDMIYYDKLSDSVVFKIEETPLTATGISYLDSNISITEG